jgi:hypothetical protein
MSSQSFIDPVTTTGKRDLVGAGPKAVRHAGIAEMGGQEGSGLRGLPASDLGVSTYIYMDI